MFRTSSRDSSGGSDSSSSKSGNAKLRSKKPSKAWGVKLVKQNSKQSIIGAIEDAFPIYSNNAKDYSLGEPIGYGASSVVYKALFTPLKIEVAVKVFNVDRLSASGIERLRREAQLMSLSKFENVLRVRGEWMDGSKLYIATRLMRAGPFHFHKAFRSDSSCASGSVKDIMEWAHPG